MKPEPTNPSPPTTSPGAHGSALSCGPNCGHSAGEHRAFDLGLKMGESGATEDDIPMGYAKSNAGLKEAWLTGHSVGILNRRNATNSEVRDEHRK